MRLLLVSILSACAMAAPQEGTTESPDLKVRVSVNLVQIDAVVTDSHGRHVTDLSAADFDLLLDGKPQTLRIFEVVNQKNEKGAAPQVRSAGKPATGGAPPALEATLKPGDVRRTVVLFVDDFSLSADRVPFVRRALHELIDKQMQPGDLVSIVRASAGIGAMKDFTTDKSLLRAAVDQVRWNSHGKGQEGAFSSGDYDHSTSTAEDAGRFYAEHFATLTIESLRRLVDGMGELPGRKSVIILSNELPIALPEYQNQLGLNTGNVSATPTDLGVLPQRMLRLADAATRASVVFYAIDTRLLFTPLEIPTPKLPKTVNTQAVSPGGYGIATGDTGLSPGQNPSADPQAGMNDYLFERGGGMFLSSRTGGFMLADSNDIGFAIGQVLDDSNGYYLLGFTPPADAFERYPDGKPKFHRIVIKLRRPGLKVRSRAGFFGESGPVGTEPAEGSELVTALDSPFRSDGVGVDLACSYLKAGRNTPALHASMIVRAQDLTLEGPPQNRSAIIHLMIRAYGVNGADLDRSADKMLRVSLNEEGYRRAMKFGLVYAMEMDIAKPGPYRVRVALRDEASGRVGTASQYLDVPNLNGRKLALSGLIFPGSFGKEDDIVPAPSPIAWMPGGAANFAFEVIGASEHAKGLHSRTRLYRDGVKIYEGPVRPLQVAAKTVHGEGFAKETLAIPAGLPAGDYALQEEVTEERPNGKPAHAWQWADLHIGALD
jgi:VWFA-related protein